MNKIKCPLCKKSSNIYLETLKSSKPDQEYDNMGIYCNCCGRIGEVDVKIEIKDARINSASSIKTEKEKIRKILQDNHREYIENTMGTW